MSISAIMPGGLDNTYNKDQVILEFPDLEDILSPPQLAEERRKIDEDFESSGDYLANNDSFVPDIIRRN